MLHQTERFQKDLQRYREHIEGMLNKQDKLCAQRLLDDLVHEVNNMDNMHMDMIYAKQLPSMGNEVRDKIGFIRKKLNSML